jgi:hypothetical protein
LKAEKQPIMTRQEIERTILNYLICYQVKEISIFGSYARFEESKTSDIDILVVFKKTPSLLKMIQIENELSEKLGLKVDLVSDAAIKNKVIRKSIDKDLQIIYHA